MPKQSQQTQPQQGSIPQQMQPMYAQPVMVAQQAPMGLRPREEGISSLGWVALSIVAFMVINVLLRIVEYFHFQMSSFDLTPEYIKDVFLIIVALILGIIATVKDKPKTIGIISLCVVGIYAIALFVLFSTTSVM